MIKIVGLEDVATHAYANCTSLYLYFHLLIQNSIFFLLLFSEVDWRPPIFYPAPTVSSVNSFSQMEGFWWSTIIVARVTEDGLEMLL